VTVILIIGLIVLLIFFRQPAFILIGVVLGAIYLLYDGGNLADIIQDMFGALNHDLLVAVPLFILAGAIMSKGSLARRMIELAIQLTTPAPGGLAVAAILACATFAAISGSSVVTLLAIGYVLYPSLKEHRYDRSLSIGALSSAGTLGIIVPPSIPLILFGLVTQTSVSDLFLAGIMPAFVIASLMIGYVIWRCRAMPVRIWNIRKILTAFKDGILALLMPIIVLGGIYSGHFTATESAGIAVCYAIIVECFIHREVDFTVLVKISNETITLIGTLFPILAVAVALNQFLAYQGVPQYLAAQIALISDTPYKFLILVTLMLLVVGCFMDMSPAVLLLGPLLTPIAVSQGINPIHFGIIMIVNLELGYLTPPMGLNLFVASTAFNENISVVARAALPFLGVMFLALLIITFVPGISLFFQ
jgi:C4-dicarboxylate transporter, DctM subunit